MNSKGFTLVELIIAFSLLLCLTATLTFMHRQSQVHSGSSNDKIKAILILQSKMEELSGWGFSQLEKMTLANFDQTKGAIKINKINSDLLSIVVTYQYKANKPPLLLETLRSNY